MDRYPNSASPFLTLPREIRDQIYSLLLKNEPHVIWIRGSMREAEPSTGIVAQGASIQQCIRPQLLRVCSWLNHEYGQLAFSRMRLTLSFALATDKGPFRLPGFAPDSGLPSHVCERLQYVTVHIGYGVFSCDFPKVDGLETALKDMPALRCLTVNICLMADLVEAACPPNARIPEVRALFTNFPSPTGQLRKVNTQLMVSSYMFEQNPTYRWSDMQEARIVGEMWLHRKNRSIFSATPSSYSYAWHGMELECVVSATWEELWDECHANPMQRTSPYVT